MDPATQMFLITSGGIALVLNSLMAWVVISDV